MGTHCERCGEANPGDARFCKSCGAPLSAPSSASPADPLVEQMVLERYRIKHLIGEGGMGRVYAAEQRVGTTVRRVAVKTLRAQLSADAQVVKRFYREAETIVRLTHPNIISFFDFGALADGTLVIVMEHIEGESLAALLSRGPLSTARVDAILAQVCSALAEAHGIGIVHRDLKPDNILLTTRGGQADFVKVLDFGIAKISAHEQDVGTKLTQQGMIVGTPPYMSPEQFRGDAVDARSDVYSLGVIAYEMHTGRLPFEARTPWEWASKHLTAEPDQLRVDVQTGVSKQRAQAIQRALSKTPDGRPSTVEMFLDELRSGESGAARPAPAYAAPPATADDAPRDSSEALSIAGLSRNRGLWIWAAVGAVALAAVGAAAMMGKPPTPAPGPPAPGPTAAAIPADAPQPLAHAEKPTAAAPEVATRGAENDSGKPHALEPARTRGQKVSDERRSQERERSRVEVASAHDGRTSTQPSTKVVASPSAEDERTRAPATQPAFKAAEGSVPRATEAKGDPGKTGTMKPAAIAAPPNVAAPTNVATPPDLSDRIAKTAAEAARRPEVAIGMYRAATSRYGANHPALINLASTIRREGDRRIKELLGNDRCAQAQALFRALTSAGLAGGAATSFGQKCPAP